MAGHVPVGVFLRAGPQGILERGGVARAGMGSWWPQIPTCIIAAAGSDEHAESRNGAATTKLHLV